MSWHRFRLRLAEVRQCFSAKSSQLVSDSADKEETDSLNVRFALGSNNVASNRTYRSHVNLGGSTGLAIGAKSVEYIASKCWRAHQCDPNACG